MIYIHIPYCHRKCTYCAFYSMPRAEGSMERYVEALCCEMERRRGEQRQAVRTLYLGGGTPSMLPLPLLERIGDAMRANFDLSQLHEGTIECNPEDLSPTYLRGLRQLGWLNRLSLGVQATSDELLHLIGRRHTAAEAEQAIADAQAAGFANITVDLIYGLPGLGLEAWRQTLRRAAAWGVQHISAYALSIEPGTAMERMVAIGRVVLPTEDEVVEQYHAMVELLRSEGYEQYEVSNFARPGYASQHNSRYWDRTPYIGLGAAAHSFDGHRRRWNSADIERYIAGTDYEDELLSEADALNESIMTALRTTRGLRRGLVADEQLQPYVQRGWLRPTPTHYCPTTEGLLHADGMAAELFV